MTTFGIFVLGCWVGFALGLLFAGTAGMLSRRDPDAQHHDVSRDGFDRETGLASGVARRA